MINQWTREELKRSHGLTVGDMIRFINEFNVPDTAKVLVERIEDAYFNGVDISGMTGQLKDGSYGILPAGSKSTGWRVYLKKGESWWHCQNWNDDIDKGTYLDADQYPRMQGKELKKFNEDQLIDAMDQYIPAFCCVKYNDEEDILFINIHY